MGRKKVYLNRKTTERGLKHSKLSNHSTRKRVIGEYHRLIKAKSQAETRGDREGVNSCELAIETLGGIEAYQQASISGHSSQVNGVFNTSEWVMNYIKQELPGETPVRMLDVGALTNHYLHHKGVESTAIDLNPQHESVRKMDFFSDECLSEFEGKFDVVVLSLVLNFVPSRAERGLMLRRSNKVLVGNGLLFLVLPKACVENSRFVTQDSLLLLLQGLGFELVQTKSSSKLFLSIFRCTNKQISTFHSSSSRQVLRKGSGRNNFSILVEEETESKSTQTNPKKNQCL